jgi:cation transport ATPase
MMSDPGMAKAMEADMRRRFFVAFVLTLPLAVISGHIPGLPMLVHAPLSSWIGLALSTPVVFWSGWVFIAGSVVALRSRKLDISVLIAV